MSRTAKFGLAANPELLILVSLADASSKRGYTIALDIGQFSGHPVLHRSTIYQAIARLVDKGLVAVEQSEQELTAYYLTASGEAFLEAQLKSLQRLASVGLQRLGLPSSLRTVGPATLG